MLWTSPRLYTSRRNTIFAMPLSPLIALANIISDSASKIDNYCADNNVQLPDLAEPFTPQAEFVLLHPLISENASYIVAAAAQLSILVKPAPLSIITTAVQFHLTSALSVAVETHTAEILREAGPQGLHIKDIASKNKANPDNLGLCLRQKGSRVLRMLATEHIFTEISPDVFANNRLSSVFDTGKAFKDIEKKPSDKHVDTSGIAALVSHFSDDVYKASSYLSDAFADRSINFSDEADKAAFTLAFKTNLSPFDYFASPGNEHRGHRFAIGMKGGSNMVLPKAVVEGFDWNSLNTGVVVDVGGGIGSRSLAVAKEYPNISFVIQDTDFMIQDAVKFWNAELPDALTTGRVKLQVHDFFQPQPVKGADVYFLRMIMHDWADSYCIKILKNLRAAAAPHSKLFLVEAVLLYACNEPSESGAKRAAEKAPPAPLLPNYGHAHVFSYMSDIQMMVMFNGKERTFQQFHSLLSSAGWQLQDTTLKPPFVSTHQYLIALPA
ncbi:hypothetical protein DXG01_000427 [Tephrocybe rancida]|nr:hypothetical protein DXG01_000427 [Tephrocybe rancida]